MHPAEFRTLRERLFFSEKDVSMLTLVKESQIKSWEMKEEPVPEGTAGLLCDIAAEIDRRITAAVDRAAGRENISLIRFKNPAEFKRHGPDMSPIPVFLAFRCHCVLIAELQKTLQAKGIETSIRYFCQK
jgi:hypothetical protein